MHNSIIKAVKIAGKTLRIACNLPNSPPKFFTTKVSYYMLQAKELANQNNKFRSKVGEIMVTKLMSLSVWLCVLAAAW